MKLFIFLQQVLVFGEPQLKKEDPELKEVVRREMKEI